MVGDQVKVLIGGASEGKTAALEISQQLGHVRLGIVSISGEEHVATRESANEIGLIVA